MMHVSVSLLLPLLLLCETISVPSLSTALCQHFATTMRSPSRGREEREGAAIMATATETEATYLDAASLGLSLHKLPERARERKRERGVTRLFVVQKSNLR